MNKRYKIKKWFKDHFTKEKIMPWVLTGIIMLLVLLCVYFENKDKKNMENKTSDISLVETDANLNKSWSINQDGNLVGNNLVNVSINYNSNGIVINTNSQLISVNGTANGNVFAVSSNTITLNAGTYSFTIQNKGNFPTNGDILVYISLPNDDRIYADSDTPFTINETITFDLFVRVQNAASINSTFNIMLNNGSTPLEWEPYGVWYSESNYDYVNNQYEAISGQVNPLDISHIVSHTEILNGNNITSEVGTTPFLSNINGGLGFYNVDVEGYSSWSTTTQNELISTNKFNTTYTIQGCKAYADLLHSQDDRYNITFYLNNEIVFTYPDIDSETDEEYMQNYTTQNIDFDMIVFHIFIGQVSVDNRGSNYFVDTNTYAFGYQEGYRDGVDSQSEAVTNAFNNGVSYADTNVNEQSASYKYAYQVGLNEGASRDISTNGIKILFDSILSYPVNMLSSVFNFEFMGINIASTIFFLISCGIVLWIIKRLWK